MGYELAIGADCIIPSQDAPAKTFAKLKERVKSLALALRTSSEEKLVKRIVNDTIDYLKDLLKRPDLENAKTTIRFYVEYSNAGFVRRFLGDLPAEKKRNDQMERLKGENYPGLTDPGRKITCINAQLISSKCKTSNEREALLVLISIHELLHHLGDLGPIMALNGKRYYAKWPGEACAEFFAEEIMKELYPNESMRLTGINLEMYHNFFEPLQELFGLVGKDVVVEAFFSKDFGIIARKAEELSVSDKLEELLRNPLKKRKKPEEEHEEEKPAGPLQKSAHSSTYSAEEREDISAKYSLDSQPGLALDTIRGVRELLPPDQRDAAARMALQATLCFKFNSDHEPTGEEVVEKVAGALEKNGGIIAYAQHDLMAEATQGLPEAFAGVTISNEEVADCREATFVEPVKDGSELLASLNLKFGGDINFETANMVEAAVVNHTLRNDGALPGPFELAETFYGGYIGAGILESTTPNASIVTDHFLTEANRLVQDTGLPPDSWIRGTARELMADEKNETTKNLQDQPYGEENHHSLSQHLERYPEFHGYSDVLIEEANALFSKIGATPTCGDITGLLAASCQIANDASLAEYYERTGPVGIPGYNPIASATSQVLDNLGGTLSSEHVKQLDAAQPHDRLDGVDSYWSSKSDGIVTPMLKGATEVFATLLEIRHPSDAIEIVPLVGVVRTGADGSMKLPDADAYSESNMIMGATQDIFDPRRRKKPAESAVVYRCEPQPMGAFGKKTEYATPIYVAGVEDPLRVTPNIKAIAEKADSHSTEPLGKIRKLFEMLKRNGELNIEASMFIDDRKTGSKTPQQVLDDKRANCLELTSLFVLAAEQIFANDGRAKVIALDVINPEQRIEIGHACAGVLIENDEITGHPRFANDWEFRRKLLEQLGVPDSPKLKLLVVDPVNCIFDYRFDNVTYLDKIKLTSFHYSNSGILSSERGEDKQANRDFELAGRLWGNNPAVLTHISHCNLENDPSLTLETLRRIDKDYVSSEVFAMMGAASSRIDRPDDALKFFNESLRLNKNSINALRGKVFIHLSFPDRKNLRAAEKCLCRLLAVKRHSRMHERMVTKAAEHENKKLDLRFGIKELGEADSSLVGIYLRLAVVYMCMGDFRKAEDVCNRGLRNAADNETLNLLKAFSLLTLNGRGIILLEQQAPSQLMTAMKEQCWRKIIVAERILDQIITLNPHSAMGHFGKAMCAALKKDKSGRDYHLENAERSDPVLAKIMRKMKSSSLDDFSYYDLFLISQLSKLTHIRKDAVGWWNQSTHRPVLHEEHEEAPGSIQIPGLENRLESAIGRNEKIKPEAVRHVREQTRRYNGIRLSILNSDLNEFEKSILLYLAQDGLRSRHDLEQCVLLQRYMADVRTISDAELEQKISELKTILEENPLGIDRRLLKELADFAKTHNLQTEEEIVALTKKTLEEEGKPLTRENMELYLPVVRKMCTIKRSPFAKVGYLDIHDCRSI